MNVIKEPKGQELNVSIVGRLDTMTSPLLENQMKGALDEIKILTLELSKLDYVSSAGLRVFLKFHQSMEKKGGKMQIRGASKDIREIFEVTGFDNIFTIL